MWSPELLQKATSTSPEGHFMERFLREQWPLLFILDTALEESPGEFSAALC